MKLFQAKKLINEINAQFAANANIDNEKNKPSLKYIGTGEGTGFEGYGLYFSTSKSTHSFYAKTVGPKSYIVDLDVSDKDLIYYDFCLGDVFDEVFHSTPNWYNQCISKVIWPNRLVIPSFYNDQLKDINARKKFFINFDRGKVLALKNPKELGDKLKYSISGFVFYKLLDYCLNYSSDDVLSNNGKLASEFLSKAGCKGIKYLDHRSREYFNDYYDEDKPADVSTLIDRSKKHYITFNYVIFDENVIKIKWKKEYYFDKDTTYKGKLNWNKDDSESFLKKLKNGEKLFAFKEDIVNFDINLHRLENGESMFNRCHNLTTFNSNLPSLKEGSNMFYGCESLSTFNSNLPSLVNGNYMFYGCESLSTFNSNLSSLEKGQYMFCECSKLTTFSSDLSSLENGNYMFYGCESLSTFISDLSRLKEGSYMFKYCPKLTTFKSNLDSLENGYAMFKYCPNLTTFKSNLDSLERGNEMFKDCSKLTTFNSNLSRLIVGHDMFKGCKLNLKSLENIANTINTVSDRNKLTLGLDKAIENNPLTNKYLEIIKQKGWDISVKYN